ncbi:hypothetical protein MPNT_60006 [Candidatus Methylacidithermus pantelleriae]|uniref:Uncharacterized protein n=1 Tax=Candidatus Methylacidithermus pantelleriae TaxID=2744239 RepID=A0A8J2BS44_9BACT|nr:hypothetical protein MPNT_60006 [Candidatus Methylacidithermus pantelleriae]
MSLAVRAFFFLWERLPEAFSVRLFSTTRGLPLPESREAAGRKACMSSRPILLLWQTQGARLGKIAEGSLCGGLSSFQPLPMGGSTVLDSG